MQNIPACQYLHGKETVKIYENFFTCSRPPKRPAEGTVTPQGQTRRRERKAANGIKTWAARRGRRSVSCRPQRCFPARARDPYGQEKGAAVPAPFSRIL